MTQSRKNDYPPPQVNLAISITTASSALCGRSVFGQIRDETAAAKSTEFREKDAKVPNQQSKYEQFRNSHIAGKPLILYNVWDAGSAKIVTSVGAKAIGTSSWAVAEALGFADGERTPLELVIDNLRRIAAATELPVSIDLESGYADGPETVGQNVGLIIGAGAAGCNLEDSFPVSGELREADDQASRIRSARQAAERLEAAFFINARSDVFFQGPSEEDNSHLVVEAIERAHLYADAGADGLFLPGLSEIELIARIAKESPLPLNILIGASTPTVAVLAENGVARVSYGGSPYADTMQAYEDAARKAYS
jgi:2-methylisocitrate lyase-like PEP mutase family enzyme